MMSDETMTDADRAFADLGSRRKRASADLDSLPMQDFAALDRDYVHERKWTVKRVWPANRLAILGDPSQREIGVLLAAEVSGGGWESGMDAGMSYGMSYGVSVVLTWDRDPAWCLYVLDGQRGRDDAGAFDGGGPYWDELYDCSPDGEWSRDRLECISCARGTPGGTLAPPLFQRRSPEVRRERESGPGEWVIESPPTPSHLIWTDFAAHLWDRVARDDTRLLVIDDTGDDATTLGLPWSRADYRHAVHLLDDMAWFGECSILLMPRDPGPWLEYARFAIRASDGLGIGGGRIA